MTRADLSTTTTTVANATDFSPSTAIPAAAAAADFIEMYTSLPDLAYVRLCFFL